MGSNEDIASAELSTRIFAIGKLAYCFALVEHLARNLGVLTSKLKVFATISELREAGAQLDGWQDRVNLAAQARNSILHQPSGHLEGSMGPPQTVRQSSRGRKINISNVVQLRTVEVAEIEAVAAELSSLATMAPDLINSLISTGHWWGPPVATTD